MTATIPTSMMMPCTTAGSIARAMAKLWELFSLNWLRSAVSTPSVRLMPVQRRKAVRVISEDVMIVSSIVSDLLPVITVGGCLAHQDFVIGAVFGKRRVAHTVLAQEPRKPHGRSAGELEFHEDALGRQDELAEVTGAQVEIPGVRPQVRVECDAKIIVLDAVTVTRRL